MEYETLLAANEAASARRLRSALQHWRLRKTAKAWRAWTEAVEELSKGRPSFSSLGARPAALREALGLSRTGDGVPDLAPVPGDPETPRAVPTTVLEPASGQCN